MLRTRLILSVGGEDVLDEHVGAQLDALGVGEAAVEVHGQDVVEVQAQHRPARGQGRRATVVCNSTGLYSTYKDKGGSGAPRCCGMRKDRTL